VARKMSSGIAHVREWPARLAVFDCSKQTRSVRSASALRGTRSAARAVHGPTPGTRRWYAVDMDPEPNGSVKYKRARRIEVSLRPDAVVGAGDLEHDRVHPHEPGAGWAVRACIGLAMVERGVLSDSHARALGTEPGEGPGGSSMTGRRTKGHACAEPLVIPHISTNYRVHQRGL
jgi:hypothetical protein